MRVLIDECVDPRVKSILFDHRPATVHENGWSGSPDGRLLAAAQREFDVLLTADGKLEHRQNLKKYSLGVVVVRVPKNQIGYYRAIQTEILAAIARVQRGEEAHAG